VNGFTEHLYTRLGTTSNYSAIADLHTLQITIPACCIFISRSLAEASNNGDSSSSYAEVLSSQPPVHNSTLNWQLTSEWVVPTVFKIIPLHASSRKCFQQYSYVKRRVYRAVAQQRLLSHCLFIGLCLATVLYATISFVYQKIVILVNYMIYVLKTLSILKVPSNQRRKK
jgi:hypothetical protein